MEENLKSSLIKKNISEFVTGNKRTLDIGCGLGMASKKISDNLIGLELSEKHYKYAKYYQKIDCRNTYDIAERNFDTIILWGSFNYIPNPHKFLENLKSRLRDDSHLIIYVPLIDRPNQDVINTRFALKYFSFFTEDTFKNLMVTQGFELIKEISELKEPIFVFKPGKKQELKRFPNESDKAVSMLVNIVHFYLKKEFEKIIEIAPNLLEAHIGFANRDAHDPQKIRDHVLRIEKQFPNYMPAQASVANFYYQWRIFDRAIDLLEWCKTKIEAYDISKNLGICYYDCGIYDKAIENFDQAIQINPADQVKIVELIQAAADKINDH